MFLSQIKASTTSWRGRALGKKMPSQLNIARPFTWKLSPPINLHEWFDKPQRNIWLPTSTKRYLDSLGIRKIFIQTMGRNSLQSVSFSCSGTSIQTLSQLLVAQDVLGIKDQSKMWISSSRGFLGVFLQREGKLAKIPIGLNCWGVLLLPSTRSVGNGSCL